MTELLQVYRCNICGNIVEVLHAGRGQLVCCGQPMELLKEQTEETGREKHVPIVEKANGKIRVKVGSVQHPMEEKHYIEWVELLTNGSICRVFLKPGVKPEAVFTLKAEKFRVREYCSVHGLWKSSIT